MAALRARDEEKAVRARTAHRRTARRGRGQLPADPDDDNFLVDDGPLFGAFAAVADRALPPDLVDVEGVE